MTEKQPAFFEKYLSKEDRAILEEYGNKYLLSLGIPEDKLDYVKEKLKEFYLTGECTYEIL